MITRRTSGHDGAWPSKVASGAVVEITPGGRDNGRAFEQCAFNSPEDCPHGPLPPLPPWLALPVSIAVVLPWFVLSGVISLGAEPDAAAPEPIYYFDLTDLNSLDLRDPVQARQAWDTLHLVASVQGIVNRDRPALFVRFMKHPDDFWWNHLREEGQLARRPAGSHDRLDRATARNLPGPTPGSRRRYRDALRHVEPGQHDRRSREPRLSPPRHLAPVGLRPGYEDRAAVDARRRSALWRRRGAVVLGQEGHRHCRHRTAGHPVHRQRQVRRLPLGEAPLPRPGPDFAAGHGLLHRLLLAPQPGGHFALELHAFEPRFLHRQKGVLLRPRRLGGGIARGRPRPGGRNRSRDAEGSLAGDARSRRRQGFAHRRLHALDLEVHRSRRGGLEARRRRHRVEVRPNDLRLQRRDGRRRPGLLRHGQRLVLPALPAQGSLSPASASPRSTISRRKDCSTTTAASPNTPTSRSTWAITIRRRG